MIPKSPKFWGDSWKQIGPYIDLGMRLTLSIVIGLFGGYWLDKTLHTLPLFLILGSLFGAFSGFLSIYHTVFPKKKK